MRARYNADLNKTSPTNSYDNVIADQDSIFASAADAEDRRNHVFNERPFCTYRGHTSDVLDINWSKVKRGNWGKDLFDVVLVVNGIINN